MTVADVKIRKDLLMVDSIFAVPQKQARENPKLWFFSGSLNSHKAHACLRFSSLRYDDIDLHHISYPEDNQTIEYNQTIEFARMNPNMRILVLEIDDKIITDSRESKSIFSKIPFQGRCGRQDG